MLQVSTTRSGYSDESPAAKVVIRDPRTNSFPSVAGRMSAGHVNSPGPLALTPDPGHKLAIGSEHPNRRRVKVGDVDLPMPVGGHGHNAAEDVLVAVVFQASTADPRGDDRDDCVGQRGLDRVANAAETPTPLIASTMSAVAAAFRRGRCGLRMAMILLSSCECGRWPIDRDRTGRRAIMPVARGKKVVAYREGRVPSANTSSSQASSLAVLASRAATQIRGWNQKSASAPGP